MNLPEFVAYEQPLNERMRMLLRVEFVLRNLHDSLGGDQVWHHRAVVLHLLDLADLLTRSDLRAEVVKELERLAGILTTMQSAPEVDRGACRTFWNSSTFRSTGCTACAFPSVRPCWKAT